MSVNLILPSTKINHKTHKTNITIALKNKNQSDGYLAQWFSHHSRNLHPMLELLGRILNSTPSYSVLLLKILGEAGC